MAEQKHPEYLWDPRGILARTLARTTTGSVNPSRQHPQLAS